MTIRIENWAVVGDNDDPFVAPEMRGSCLHGEVTDHPKIGAGRVLTSIIVGIEGRIVTTYSGSRYELGEPSEKYREWLHVHRPNWNPEKPIVMRG
ncbi:MAG: hypothetical protein ABSH28_01780 [Acidobacteriota bacterium]|jgi:hypothetical protein